MLWPPVCLPRALLFIIIFLDLVAPTYKSSLQKKEEGPKERDRQRDRELEKPNTLLTTSCAFTKPTVPAAVR